MMCDDRKHKQKVSSGKQQVREELTQRWRGRSLQIEEKKREEEERIRDSKQSTQQFPHSSVGEAVI